MACELRQVRGKEAGQAPRGWTGLRAGAAGAFIASTPREGGRPGRLRSEPASANHPAIGGGGGSLWVGCFFFVFVFS